MMMLRRTRCILAIGAALMLKSILALSSENPASHHVLRPDGSPRLMLVSSRRNEPSCSSRRALLVAASAVASLLPASPAFALAKDLKEEYRQGTAALADDDSTAPVPREAYRKLDSGVVFADLRTGNGEAAKVGSRVNLQWVLRKSNGYFVDSSEVNDSVPFIFTVGDGTAIAGLNEAVQGMKVGGVRRILIPPSLAYVNGLDDGKPGPLPTGFGPRQQMRRVQTVRKDVPGEYVYLEVQMTRLR
jgi:FKBP-type peptidyl-prolyl cis-trans isomerase